MTRETADPTDEPASTGRLPYLTPKLARYGAVQAVTLTVNLNMNKNDSSSGSGLKT